MGESTSEGRDTMRHSGESLDLKLHLGTLILELLSPIGPAIKVDVQKVHYLSSPYYLLV